MIITGERGEWVVYNTGPDHGHHGEMRRVLLADLLHHPDPTVAPGSSQPELARCLPLEYICAKTEFPFASNRPYQTDARPNQICTSRPRCAQKDSVLSTEA